MAKNNLKIERKISHKNTQKISLNNCHDTFVFVVDSRAWRWDLDSPKIFAAFVRFFSCCQMSDT